MKDAIIIANGQYPHNKVVLDMITKDSFIIACDGASSTLLKHNIEPDIIIGDLDSVESEVKEQYKDKVIYVSCQDTNDLTKAYNYAINQGFKNIKIFGAMGLRDDHAIANFALLAQFYKDDLDLKMITDFGMFSCHKTPFTYECKKDTKISLFCFDVEAKLTSQGLLYKLDDLQLTALNMATLNTTTQDKFSMHSNKSDVLMIVYEVF